jgi:hypothetical protein
MNYLTQEEIKNVEFKKIGSNVLITKKASISDPKEIEVGNNSGIDDFSMLYGSIKIRRNIHVSLMCLIGA